MRKRIRKSAQTLIAAAVDIESPIVPLVGFATFFFGFGAGAILSLYLTATGSPLVEHLRTSINFKSSIFGDGIVLPFINMVAASFFLRHREHIAKKTLRAAFISGGLITLYFHVDQAVNGLVNWAMPTPWHWNILGLWHALYMFSVATFLSLFYFVCFKALRKRKHIQKEAILVTFGLLFFFFLLRLDYLTLTLGNIVPR